MTLGTLVQVDGIRFDPQSGGTYRYGYRGAIVATWADGTHTVRTALRDERTAPHSTVTAL